MHIYAHKVVNLIWLNYSYYLKTKNVFNFLNPEFYYSLKCYIKVENNYKTNTEFQDRILNRILIIRCFEDEKSML